MRTYQKVYCRNDATISTNKMESKKGGKKNALRNITYGLEILVVIAWHSWKIVNP